MVFGLAAHIIEFEDAAQFAAERRIVFGKLRKLYHIAWCVGFSG